MESKKEKKSRDREIIADPERKEWMDIQRKRGRDSHEHTPIDVERQTEVSRNCRPGRAPPQSSQHGLGAVAGWLALQNGWGTVVMIL